MIGMRVRRAFNRVLGVFRAVRGIETCGPLTPLSRASPEDSGSENSPSDSRCAPGYCALCGGVSTYNVEQTLNKLELQFNSTWRGLGHPT